MPGKFARQLPLAQQLPADVFNNIVNQLYGLLTRRYNSLFDDIQHTNFNPFLMLALSPAYGINSPLEIAENLQMKKVLHGDDTAYGKFIEEKIVNTILGGSLPAEKKNPALKEVWSPIDQEVMIEGERVLFSIKAGPWTMNQAHTNEMIANLPEIHRQTGCKIILGITYGRLDQLNNKPKLVADTLQADYFDYMVGEEFWEYVTGVEDAHKHIFMAIREAQTKFHEAHKDLTFSEKILSSRLKVAQSIRTKFNISDTEDIWDSLLKNAF